MLRGVLDEASEGLLALDEHGAIVEANAAAAALLGHDRRRLHGKPFAALVALDDRRQFRRSFGALKPGAAELLELRLLGRDLPIHVRLRLLPANGERVTSVVLAEQRPADVGAVREDRSDRLEYFLLRLPYGIVAFRSDLRIAFANARARTLLGREAVRSGTPFGAGVAHELLP